MSRRTAPQRADSTWLNRYPYDKTRMERLRAREEDGETFFQVMALLFFAIAIISGIDTARELRVTVAENQKLFARTVLLQEQLNAATGQDVQSASLIVGKDEVVETPLGKLLVSAQTLEAQTEYDPRVAVTAKFLDGGYSWSIPTDGTWATHNEGWQLQIAPTGYSVGYEYNYDENGEFTTLKNSYQYFTLLWRPAQDDWGWSLVDQAVQKGAQIANQ